MSRLPHCHLGLTKGTDSLSRSLQLELSTSSCLPKSTVVSMPSTYIDHNTRNDVLMQSVRESHPTAHPTPVSTCHRFTNPVQPDSSMLLRACTMLSKRPSLQPLFRLYLRPRRPVEAGTFTNRIAKASDARRSIRQKRSRLRLFRHGQKIHSISTNPCQSTRPLSATETFPYHFLIFPAPGCCSFLVIVTMVSTVLERLCAADRHFCIAQIYLALRHHFLRDDFAA